ncbi:response regulator [Methanoculleus sp. Wushi-C6]|uniref:Response regulator n=1 Tax=Methanoculleus caldifontis TaxID=2651577 RepID=A0ABU3WXS6_9EURY|nr:hypothetical protein [Methanoculleus sp. Wushi-C6]MDV2480607.1 response regulator [Methanoculleus sp. Wushi-C6]
MGSLTPLNVLLAVPDNSAAGTLSTWLQERGHTVVGVAVRGEDALRAAAASRPGVVVLDASLPCPMSPLWMALAIRDGLGIPILLATADPHDTLPAGGEAALSPQEILAVPFGPESLAAAVETLVACERARGSGGRCTALTSCLQKEVLQQLETNIEQLATLNDRIRNPLQVITAYAGLMEGDARDAILLQVAAIDEVVRQLDRGTLASVAVREYLRKHREIPGS